MRLLRALSALAPFVFSAAVCAAETNREQAISIAVSFAAGELDDSKQAFNIVVPDNAPFFPIVVASLGTPRRTYLATGARSCEIQGRSFSDHLYAPAAANSRVNISEDAGAQGLILAFQTAGEASCVAAVRRCRDPNDPASCITIVRGAGVGGLIADSHGGARPVQLMDPALLLPSEDANERQIALVGAAVLAAPDADVVGFGPIGATTRDGDAWRFYLPTADLASSAYVPFFPPSKALSTLRAPRGAGFPVIAGTRGADLVEADVERIYQSAGFRDAKWREILRVHPAVALRGVDADLNKLGARP